MPISLYLRPNGVWYLRGSHHGISVDRSSRTRDQRAAEKVREKVEREIFDAVILKKPPEKTFAEAAIGYMKSGGERGVLPPILTCKLRHPSGSVRTFGDWFLTDIDQSAIDALAEALHAAHSPATKNRKIYTPVAAVLNWAHEQPTWRYAPFRIRRPEQPRGRIDWRRPAEIEWWLARAGHLMPLITAYAGTGARASELVHLRWSGVSPGAQRVTLWEDETKAEAARFIDLQARVRAAWPMRPPTARDADPVFCNLAGVGFASYDAVNNHLEKISEREALRAATKTELAELNALRSARRSRRSSADAQAAARAAYPKALAATIARHQVPQIHCHVLRHTWATWAYAVTRDLTFLMGQGGWASEKLALRYIHGGSDDIRAEVLDHGWEMRPSKLEARKESA